MNIEIRNYNLSLHWDGSIKEPVTHYEVNSDGVVEPNELKWVIDRINYLHSVGKLPVVAIFEPEIEGGKS